MDNFGGKHGTGEYNATLEKLQRDKRLKELNPTNNDLENDYVFHNQYGLLECRLCRLHFKTTASYLAHASSKTHQLNIHRRNTMLAKKQALAAGVKVGAQPKSNVVVEAPKMGNPEFKVYNKKVEGVENYKILFEIYYPEIKKHTQPKFRIVSTYEQSVEPPNPEFQYLVVAAIPYNSVGFKIPNVPILIEDTLEEWNHKDKKYTVQITICPSNTA